MLLNHGSSGELLCMTAGMLHPNLGDTPVTDLNKAELVRLAALQQLLFSRARGLAALKRGMVETSGLKPALTLFAGCPEAFGALFFGQAYLAPEDVAAAVWFGRDVPEALAQALLQVMHRLSEISLRTFWAAATGSVSLAAGDTLMVVMAGQQGGSNSSSIGSTGGRRASITGSAASDDMLQFVPSARTLLLPQTAEQRQEALEVLVEQRLLRALNLGDNANSTAAQQQARVTAAEMQQVVTALQGDVQAGERLAKA